MKQKILGLTMALAMLVPMGAISAAPSGAAAHLVSCKPPAGKLAITPGLGTTPKIQTVNIKLPLVGCTGTGGVKSGTSTGKSVGTAKTSFATFFKNPKSTNV